MGQSWTNWDIWSPSFHITTRLIDSSRCGFLLVSHKDPSAAYTGLSWSWTSNVRRWCCFLWTWSEQSRSCRKVHEHDYNRSTSACSHLIQIKYKIWGDSNLMLGDRLYRTNWRWLGHPLKNFPRETKRCNVCFTTEENEVRGLRLFVDAQRLSDGLFVIVRLSRPLTGQNTHTSFICLTHTPELSHHLCSASPSQVKETQTALYSVAPSQLLDLMCIHPLLKVVPNK